MLKQTSKLEYVKSEFAHTERDFTETACRVGAWVLTAAALLASADKLQHIEPAAITVPVADHAMVQDQQDSRAEGARETARLPEEYDIGLRMPANSGS